MDFIPFSKIIGQDKAIGFLKQAMALGKLPHAYLFTGIPGIGKTTTALALAQAINCAEAKEGEGCGECVSCRQWAGGNFPDLQVIEPDGQFIKIEQVRGIDREMGFKPLSGRCRVVIIRSAERMTMEAANAFLKTLEEPPPGNILILNASEPLDLLPTIVSRCQNVGFRPIPASLAAPWLEEKTQMGRDKASLLARIAEGSLGKALEMWEEGILEKRAEYITTLMSLKAISEIEAVEMALRLTGKEKGQDQEKDGDILPLLNVWKTWYRDLLVVKGEGPPESLINGDLYSELKKAAQGFRIDQLVSSLLLIDQGERDFRRSRNLDLMMENLLLGLRGFMGETGGGGDRENH
jgi:DNA polymerase-3 subunit delta'